MTTILGVVVIDGIGRVLFESAFGLYLRQSSADHPSLVETVISTGRPTLSLRKFVT